MQHTLKTATDWIEGIGLHTGAAVSLRILPSAPDTGHLFVRTDISAINSYVPALAHSVDPDASRLCTYLRNDSRVSIQTPEHIMAAFAAYGIDNALIEITGPEVPLMDGTTMPFLAALQAVGRKVQPAPRYRMRMIKTVTVMDGDKSASLAPIAGDHLVCDYTVNYPGLGRQHKRFTLTDADMFASELGRARTFTLRSIALAMKANGGVRGGSLENALVLNDEDGTPYEGQLMHYADEPVRHKIMDAIGDLTLAGMPIIGHFTCDKGGHALTNQLVRAVLSDPSSFEIVADMAGMRVPMPRKVGINQLVH